VTDAREPRGGTSADRWLLSWAGLIAVVLLLPPGLVPGLGAASESGLDKLGHAVLFLVLGLLALGPVRARFRRPLLVALVAGLLYGAALEVVQGAFGWREAELADVVADGVGTAAGVVAAWWRAS
jgi:VanZ family protein